MQRIISLDDIAATDVALVGGKSANLAIMKQAGLPVPNGFAVPFDAFDQYASTKSVDPELIEELACNTYGRRQAVRSSANIEDSRRASFAGQFETKLNVESEPELLAGAIKDCLEAARQYSGEQYTSDMNINEEVRMALTIQDMVENPICSGVIFTQDPTTGNRDVAVINCTTGLADRLVNGEISGELYKVDRATGKRIDGNGNQIMNKKQVVDLIQISSRIEKLFGLPQDIEFAFSEDGKLQILQARPISSYSLNTNAVIENERKIIASVVRNSKKQFGLETFFSNSNIVENFPEPTPMGLGIFNYMFIGTEDFPGAIQIGRNKMGYACGEETYKNPLFRMICGKPYMDFVVDALTFRLAGVDLQDYLDGFVSHYVDAVAKEPSKGNYPEGGLYIQHPNLEFLIETFGKEKGQRYFEVYQKFHQNIRKFEQEFYKEFRDEKIPALNEYCAKAMHIDFGSLSKEELVEKFQEYMKKLRTEACVDFVKVARMAFFGYDRLRNNIEQIAKQYGDDFLRETLREQGIKPDKEGATLDSLDHSGLLKLTLDALLQAKPADIINETQELGRALDQRATGELSVDDFLARYGHVGQLEISLPRYAEEREYFSNLQPNERKNKNAAKLDCGMSLRKILSSKLNESANDFVKNAEMANVYLPLRETAKMNYFKVHYLAKRTLLALSDKCKLPGKEIFYLEPTEVNMLLDNENEAFQLIKYRQNSADAHREIDAPALIYKNTPIEKIKIIENADGTIELSGEPVRNGMSKGIALVAHSNIEFAKKYDQFTNEGIEDIIGVFPAMDPSYGTRNRFAGLITQYGGVLAHAAIIARDQKIPYLTNVPINQIPDRAKVAIDGSDGKIFVEVSK